MPTWTPLRFTPLYKTYLWGGHRLRVLFGRPLDPEQIYAESWEICDHDEDQSVVEAGPWAGKTLHEMVVEQGAAILGEGGLRASASLPTQRFPLLLKYLDAQQNLSLQVHPDDAMAARLTPPDLGKTEAWVVLDAEPGSLIHAGLKPGVDRPALAEAIEQGTCESCLHRFEPVPGDCLLIPAGTVHALGAGVMVAEIQQASDTTFRLFDWNRVGPDGRPRPLHIQQGLEAINFRLGPALPLQKPLANGNQPVVLVECDQFVLVRRAVSSPFELGGDGQFHMITVLAGALSIENDPTEAPLSRGQSALLPAALETVQLSPQDRAVLLEIKMSGPF